MKKLAEYHGRANGPEEIPIHPEKPTTPQRENPTPVPGKIPEVVPPIEPIRPGQQPVEIPNPDHPLKH